MREKLIELLGKVTCTGNGESLGSCPDRKYGLCGEVANLSYCVIQNMANHLIANGVTVQQWIPVTERLPEEHDSIFTSFHGTEKWQDGMFLKCSDTVLASVEYEDCKRRVKAIVTKDGKWDLSKLYRASKVTHWIPLPQPPKEG